MIPQRNLSMLSNRLGLSRSELRDKLLFKGGTALKRCYFGDYRFSELCPVRDYAELDRPLARFPAA
jgi:hypothetical protein